jgi:hypothetical protein
MNGVQPAEALGYGDVDMDGVVSLADSSYPREIYAVCPSLLVLMRNKTIPCVARLLNNITAWGRTKHLTTTEEAYWSHRAMVLGLDDPSIKQKGSAEATSLATDSSVQPPDLFGMFDSHPGISLEERRDFLKAPRPDPAEIDKLSKRFMDRINAPGDDMTFLQIMLCLFPDFDAKCWNCDDKPEFIDYLVDKDRLDFMEIDIGDNGDMISLHSMSDMMLKQIALCCRFLQPGSKLWEEKRTIIAQQLAEAEKERDEDRRQHKVHDEAKWGSSGDEEERPTKRPRLTASISWTQALVIGCSAGLVGAATGAVAGSLAVILALNSEL